MVMLRRAVLFALFLTLPLCAFAQGQQGRLSQEQMQRRHDIEKQLEDIAVIDRKVMVAMRDGTRMQADVYRPKDTSKKYPAIFVRTPYNFNFWDIQNGVPRDMT